MCKWVFILALSLFWAPAAFANTMGAYWRQHMEEQQRTSNEAEEAAKPAPTEVSPSPSPSPEA